MVDPKLIGDRLFGSDRGAIGLYDALCTTRAIRRLRRDPIPDAVLERVLRAAICAPTGGNAQPWRVVVVKSAERKRALAEPFRAAWRVYSAPARERMERLPPETRERGLRVMAAGDALAAHFADAPVVTLWLHDPRLLANEHERELQPNFLFGGSLYPAIQNLLLAARAEGLGGVLTTMGWRHEPEILAALGVPEPWRLHATVPLGYPEAGGHGAIARKPLERMAYLEQWQAPYPATGSPEREVAKETT